MFVRSREGVTGYERYGLASRTLLRGEEVAGVVLTVTWVDVVAAGRGWMRVGEERRKVGAEGLVRVPSGSVYRNESTSNKVLTHVSATTAALDTEMAYASGRLCSQRYRLAGSPGSGLEKARTKRRCL